MGRDGRGSDAAMGAGPPPLSRAGLERLLSLADEHDRATHTPGRRGGELGRPGQAVLRALARFHDPKTGRCDPPSLEALAALACVARSTAVEALARLRAAGFVTWTRRAAEAGRGSGRPYARAKNAYRLALPEPGPG